MKHAAFYATTADMLGLLEELDQSLPLRYALCGNFLSCDYDPAQSCFDTGREIPHLGLADAESSIACKSYLTQMRPTTMIPRMIDGNDGRRVCIDQLRNPDSVIFTPGGVWTGTVLLQGRVATSSSSEISSALMREFRTGLKKCFRAIRGCRLGPEAMQLLRGGMRLTTAVQSPREHDFCL